MKSIFLSVCLLIAGISFGQVNVKIVNSTSCTMYVYMETEVIQYQCNDIDQDNQTVNPANSMIISTATGNFVSWIDAHAVGVGGGVAFHVCDGEYMQTTTDHCVVGMNIKVEYDEPNGYIYLTEF